MTTYTIRRMFLETSTGLMPWYRAVVSDSLFGSGFTEQEAIDDADRELLRAVMKGEDHGD